MHGDLYRYFLLYKKLSVPGIGTYFLERKPARLDFAEKLVYPPVFYIRLQVEEIPADASLAFNSVYARWNSELDEKGSVDWKGAGRIEKTDERIFFHPYENTLLDPVPAIRVLREKVTHTVLVGEDEKTSVQMEEWLNETPAVKRSLWWAWALGIGLLAVLFLGWYFSENGLDVSATANGQKLNLPGNNELHYTSY